MPDNEVTFGPKDSWQKPDCLFCDNPATLQANASNSKMTATIRCCTNEDCKARAEKLARVSVNGGAS